MEPNFKPSVGNFLSNLMSTKRGWTIIIVAVILILSFIGSFTERGPDRNTGPREYIRFTAVELNNLAQNDYPTFRRYVYGNPVAITGEISSATPRELLLRTGTAWAFNVSTNRSTRSSISNNYFRGETITVYGISSGVRSIERATNVRPQNATILTLAQARGLERRPLGTYDPNINTRNIRMFNIPEAPLAAHVPDFLAFIGEGVTNEENTTIRIRPPAHQIREEVDIIYRGPFDLAHINRYLDMFVAIGFEEIRREPGFNLLYVFYSPDAGIRIYSRVFQVSRCLELTIRSTYESDGQPTEPQEHLTELQEQAPPAPVISPSGVIMYEMFDRPFASYVPDFLAFVTNGATVTDHRNTGIRSSEHWDGLYEISLTHNHDWTESDQVAYLDLLRQLGFDVIPCDKFYDRYNAWIGNLSVTAAFEDGGTVYIIIVYSN